MPLYTVLLIVAVATGGTWGPKLVAQDFDAARLGRRAVAGVVGQEISSSCAEHDADHRPLDADLHGQISSKLQRLRAR